MLLDGIINLILFFFEPILEVLPTIDLSGIMSSTGVSTFLDWISLAGYMLPFDTFFAIGGIIFSLQIFRIVIAFFKSLWGVLPVA